MAKCKICNFEFCKRFKFKGKRFDYRGRVNCFNCVPIKLNNYDKELIEYMYESESKYRKILNKYNQAHDVKNLFVVDGGAFVSQADKNPTWTILALSLRASEYIIDQLKKQNI